MRAVRGRGMWKGERGLWVGRRLEVVVVDEESMLSSA